jgi:Fur family ferric uptake transcriptional regulator/Fur family peroxide stress response transcriptional regulator
VTPQRQAIFRALNSAAHHQTAERIYLAVSTELPTISLRTVYQALNDLSAMGELSALDLGTGATRFDPNLEPHHHLVCEVCGRIEDLHHEFSGVLLPAQVAARFTVTAAEIVFRGRCADCDQTPIHPARESTRAAPASVSSAAGSGTQRATRAGRHGHRSRAPRSRQ